MSYVEHVVMRVDALIEILWSDKFVDRNLDTVNLGCSQLFSQFVVALVKLVGRKQISDRNFGVLSVSGELVDYVLSNLWAGSNDKKRHIWLYRNGSSNPILMAKTFLNNLKTTGEREVYLK